MEKNLYFCSKDPTASSFNIYVSGGSSRFRNLDADTEEAKPSPIDKIKYYNFDLYIEDLENNVKLEGAVIIKIFLILVSLFVLWFILYYILLNYYHFISSLFRS